MILLLSFIFESHILSYWFEVVDPSESTIIEHLSVATKLQMEQVTGIEPA